MFTEPFSDSIYTVIACFHDSKRRHLFMTQNDKVLKDSPHHPPQIQKKEKKKERKKYRAGCILIDKTRNFD